MRPNSRRSRAEHPLSATPHAIPESSRAASQVKKVLRDACRGGRTRLVNGEAFYGKLES